MPNFNRPELLQHLAIYSDQHNKPALINLACLLLPFRQSHWPLFSNITTASTACMTADITRAIDLHFAAGHDSINWPDEIEEAAINAANAAKPLAPPKPCPSPAALDLQYWRARHEADHAERLEERARATEQHTLLLGTLNGLLERLGPASAAAVDAQPPQATVQARAPAHAPAQDAGLSRRARKLLRNNFELLDPAGTLNPDRTIDLLDALHAPSFNYNNKTDNKPQRTVHPPTYEQSISLTLDPLRSLRPLRSSQLNARTRHRQPDNGHRINGSSDSTPDSRSSTSLRRHHSRADLHRGHEHTGRAAQTNARIRDTTSHRHDDTRPRTHTSHERRRRHPSTGATRHATTQPERTNNTRSSKPRITERSEQHRRQQRRAADENIPPKNSRSKQTRAATPVPKLSSVVTRPIAFRLGPPAELPPSRPHMANEAYHDAFAAPVEDGIDADGYDAAQEVALYDTDFYDDGPAEPSHLHGEESKCTASTLPAPNTADKM
jgi:hypothetical protein